MDETKYPAPAEADRLEAGIPPPASNPKPTGGRLASVLKRSATHFSPAPIDTAREESEERAASEIVAELAAASVPLPPRKLKASRTSVAPYGPDEPLDLQNTLRGKGALMFDLAYVPSIGQSMDKVRRICVGIYISGTALNQSPSH
jgi:hypothetical protein